MVRQRKSYAIDAGVEVQEAFSAHIEKRRYTKYRAIEVAFRAFRAFRAFMALPVDIQVELMYDDDVGDKALQELIQDTLRAEFRQMLQNVQAQGKAEKQRIPGFQQQLKRQSFLFGFSSVH